MKTKIAWIAVALVLVGGGWLIAQKNAGAPSASPISSASQAVATSTITGDKQVIEITVKDGYQPKDFTAKAGMPMVLKMKTQGTFDCTASFSIPKLNIQARLQPTGESTFDIPAQKVGDSIYGVCSMGMYTFVIKFT